MGFADVSERTLLIDDGRVVALRAAAGSTVRVLAGTVRVTEDGRRDDVVLRAGDRATLRGPGLALVEAIGRAGLRVASPERARSSVRRRAPTGSDAGPA